MHQIKQIIRNNLWNNNPVLVQLLGLCPLLAVSSSVINSLALGFSTTLVLCLSAFITSILRKIITKPIRIPIFILIIATFVSIISLVLEAHFFEIFQDLGIFIPLIVTNCLIIGRLESFSIKNNPLLSTIDAFFLGLGFCVILFILGAIREFLATGSIFANMDLLFSDSFKNFKLTIFEFETGFLLSILPAGAFFVIAFLLALKNYIDTDFNKT